MGPSMNIWNNVYLNWRLKFLNILSVFEIFKQTNCFCVTMPCVNQYQITVSSVLVGGWGPCTFCFIITFLFSTPSVYFPYNRIKQFFSTVGLWVHTLLRLSGKNTPLRWQSIPLPCIACNVSMGRRRNYFGGQIRVKRAICWIIIFIRSFQEFGHDIKIIRFKSYGSIFGRHSFVYRFTSC